MNSGQKVTLGSNDNQFPPHIQHEIDKLEFVFDSAEEHLEMIRKSGNLLKKSVEISIEARKAGNDLYIKKGHNAQIHNSILGLYSKSIAFAPKGTEELVLGYGNRASLLMHLHHYEESLVDIDRALELSNDDAFKKKLQARKEKCLDLIKKKNLEESAKIPNLNEDQETLASKLKEFTPSATLPCASDCVGLACNDTFGRHLVATRDIEPGEILIIEEGNVCYPPLDKIYLLCSHCLQIAWNGIPCDKCVFAIYCSETCKDEAYQEYHDIECPIVAYLDHMILNYESKGPDRMVTIRLLAKAVKKEGYNNIFKQILGERNEENLDGLLSDGILQSDKFQSCYNLLSNEKHFASESEQSDFHTLLIVYLLMEYTNFLDHKMDNAKSDLSKSLQSCIHFTFRESPYILLKYKEVLTKLKYITDINAYVFQKPLNYECDCKSVLECQQKCNFMRGIVVVPCCSLLNHSCTPNVAHISATKRKIMVFSTCPIKKGEMLCDSYGGISLLEKDLKERRKAFKKYYFKCKCKACSDKIDLSVLSDVSMDDYEKIVNEFQKSFPMAPTNLVFEDLPESNEISENKLQYMIKISQLFYKYFNFYEAYKHSYKCQAYFKKMMSKLYEEKIGIPGDC